MWILKRIIEKIEVMLRACKVSLLYHTKNKVTLLGKVYLHNPNIKFGENVVLYPGVHIFGQGKVTLGNNVSIGDGTIICAAKDIQIGNDTMIAAQCYILDCNHGMKIGGGTCVRNRCQFMKRKLVKMFGSVVAVKYWLEVKLEMVL